MRRRPRWSQNGGGPLAHAAGASVIPKQKRPPCTCGGGIGGHKMEEAPSHMRRGPQWSQNGGGPLAHAARGSVVQKRRRPPCTCGGDIGGP